MNKRIRELAEQAKQHANIYNDVGTPSWLQMYNEKFATLIIKECIACCDSAKKIEWMEPPTYELGVAACKTKIQMQFGVK